MICPKCKKILVKSGTLIMSNSKYEIFKCPECGLEKKQCVGVLN